MNISQPSSNITDLWRNYYEIARPVYAHAIPFLLVLCFIAIVANIILLTTVRYVSSAALNSTLKLTYSLACADLWMSTVLAFGLVANSYWSLVLRRPKLLGDRHECLMHIVEACRLGAMITSVLHLMTLAFDHLSITVRPHRTREHTCALTIVTIWTIPTGSFIALFAILHEHTFSHPTCQAWLVTTNAFRACLLATITIPLIITGVVYVRLMLILKSIHDRTGGQRIGFIRRRMATVVTALCIVSTFLLGWLPGVVWMMITCESCLLPLSYLFVHNPQSIFITGITVNALFISKGILNPAVYASRMPTIKNAALQMIAGVCHRHPLPTISSSTSATLAINRRHHLLQMTTSVSQSNQ